VITPLVVLAMVGAGGIAAVARYLVSLTVTSRRGLPIATFVVNIVGTAIGAAAAGLAHAHIFSPGLELILLTGVAGGLTTFSTWSVETIGLVQKGRWGVAAANVAANLAVGLAVAAIAYSITSGL